MRDAMQQTSFYAAVLLVGVAFFFGLHYVGNRIPYDLALERITDELESDRRDLGYLSGLIGDFEYCQRAAVVLGGAKRFEGDNPALDAVLPRLIAVEGVDGYCETLTLLHGNEDVRKGWIKHRYWWGSTALYAIALRFLSDADIREWTRILTICAWGLLSLVLWFLSRRAFLAVFPLAVFASFFSGLQYFSDAWSGLPFLWTPFFAVALAFAMSRRSMRATRLCCFVIGMGSSYLWSADGHNALLIALIGLVVYFGSDHPSARRRIGAAAMCLALYAAGFALCFAANQLVKAAALEWVAPWGSFSDVFSDLRQVFVYVDRLSTSLTSGLTSRSPTGEGLSGGLTAYWVMGPDRVAIGQVVTLLSGALFLISLAFAAARAFSGRKPLLADIAWIVCLAAAASLQFIIPNDVFVRIWRYPFVLHGLCWSCFLLAAKEAFGQWREASDLGNRPTGNRRSRRMAARHAPRDSTAEPKVRLPKEASVRAFLIGAVVVLAGAALLGWSATRSESAFARETIAVQQPRIYGPFNVHYNENKLVYERAECDEYDAAPRFNLHILPVNRNDIPDDRVESGFDNLDFIFTAHKVPYGDGCAAVVALPDYEIEAVSTGQFISGERQIWSGEFRPDQPPPPSVAAMSGLLEGAELMAQSEFGVYRNENTLLWTKASCSAEDVAPRFFVHLQPVNIADLPEERQQFGFDNMDFNFADSGVFGQGRPCIAAMQLPDYPMAAARTGQFTAGREVWSVEFRFDRPSALVVASMMELLEDAELLAQSNFDVYRNENTLLWTKTPCDVRDATPRFFVHLQPVNIADLPEERQQFGFDNMDFNFADSGGFGRGKTCVAAVELPDYPVSVARTGQFTAEGLVWQEIIEFR